jgi:hypothetical protein
MRQEDDRTRVYIGGQRIRRDRLSSFSWAFIFIWAGLVFLAKNLNLIPSWTSVLFNPIRGGQWLSAWPLVFIGAGVILIIEVIVRLIVPDLRSHFGGALIMSLIFLSIGLGQVISWSIIGPLILIAFGLSFLLRGVIRD